MSDSQQSQARSAMAAARNLVIAAVVLLGMFLAYSKYVNNSKAIKALNKKAFDLIQRDNPKEYAEAAKALDEALNIRAKEPFAVSARAEIASILWAEYGDTSEKDVAQQLVTKVDGLGLNTKERFQADGLSAIAAGDLGTAEKILVDLTAKGIAPAEVVAPLGMVHARQGKLEMAKSDFKQAADREFRSARYYGLYGDAFYDAGDFTNASVTYQKALDLNPAHVRSLIGRARADVARNERVDEATAAIADLLAKGADEVPPVMKARALAAKSEALFAAGKYADAESAANEAIAAEVKADPASAYAHYDLALALAKQKKQGAGQAIKDAIALYPPVARFYFQGALALAEAGDAAAGQELFDLYGKNYNQNDVYQIARGDFLRATGDLTKALEAYDAALASTQTNAEAWFKKGYTLQLQGQAGKGDKKKLYNSAREAYEKAVGIREKYPEVYRQMGLIYLDADPRSGEATDAFGKALAFYKEQKAPKATVDGFIDEVEARYNKAGLKGNAAAWRKEATQMMK